MMDRRRPTTNLEAVRELIDPDDMVEVGVNCSLQQLEHGFPLTGNLLALSDGRLCYLDF